MRTLSLHAGACALALAMAAAGLADPTAWHAPTGAADTASGGARRCDADALALQAAPARESGAEPIAASRSPGHATASHRPTP